MQLFFKTNKLEKQLTDPKEMKKSFGQMAKKVNQRIQEMKSSGNLEVLCTIPAARCHKLKGDRKGQFSVDISANYRLIFEPYHIHFSKKVDNSIDCIKVTSIIILKTEDYH